MEMKECYLCGKVGPTERHHVFGGSYRQLSEEYGCVVDLCPACHRHIHSSKGTEDRRQLQCDIQYQTMDANEWDLNWWLLIFNKSWL